MSLLFVVAQAAMSYWFLLLSDEGAPIDRLVKIITKRGYQEWIDKFYEKKEDNLFLFLLSQVMGACIKCYTFWFGVLFYFVYYAFIKSKMPEIWISSGINSISGIVIVNIIWFVAFTSISNTVSFNLNKKLIET